MKNRKLLGERAVRQLVGAGQQRDAERSREWQKLANARQLGADQRADRAGELGQRPDMLERGGQGERPGDAALWLDFALALSFLPLRLASPKFDGKLNEHSYQAPKAG